MIPGGLFSLAKIGRRVVDYYWFVDGISIPTKV